MLNGFYIIRNDLTVLELYEGITTGYLYPSWLATQWRRLATRFNTIEEAREVIKLHRLQHCVPVEFN